jgi:hypothetical protein
MVRLSAHKDFFMPRSSGTIHTSFPVRKPKEANAILLAEQDKEAFKSAKHCDPAVQSWVRLGPGVAFRSVYIVAAIGPFWE